MEENGEIMEATFSALKKHGYSQLSIKKIADEMGKTKSSLYHHYDGKDEILIAFMKYMLEKFQDKTRSQEKEPEAALREKCFRGFCGDKEKMKAVSELRAQAIRDQKFRKRFRKFSEAYRKELKNILEQGKREKVFREDLNVERTVYLIDALNKEAMLQRSLEEDTEHLRAEIEKYLDEKVIK